MVLVLRTDTMSSSPEPSSNHGADVIPWATVATPGSWSVTTAMATIMTDDTITYPPMTTPWTTPLSCTWTYDIDQTLKPGMSGPVAYLDLEPISDASTLTCYPDGMFFGSRTGTFSPGTCPNGWTTVSLRQNTNEPMDRATTTAVCCSSYVYN